MRSLSKVSVRLALLVGACGALYSEASWAQEDTRDVYSLQAAAVPDDLVWKEVAPATRQRVLALLNTHTRGNFEKIKTWAASYFVHLETYVSRASVQHSFAGRLPENCTPDLIQESESAFRIVLDMESGSVFRDRTHSRFRMLRTDSRESVVIPGIRPIDNRSIVTRDHYVYFNPKHPPATYAVCTDNPEAKDKRAARRVAPEETRGLDQVDMFSPRLLFRCSAQSMNWEELDMYAGLLKGKEGTERQKQAEERVRLDEALHGGRTWYRMRVMITFPEGRVDRVTSVWSPFSGYNHVSLTFAAAGDAGDTVVKSQSWKWKDVDGIYVPALTTEVWRPQELGGIETYTRIADLTECALNKPLSPDQFTYASLGLGQGDLILDDIEKAVLIIRDGKPERLAGYNEPYVVTQFPGRTRASRWSWLLALNAVFGAVVLTIALHRKFRRDAP